eukprot:m.83224 g.83224  ORF g.83224 m.83224 type:complete len:269 (+) comp50804_c0_seq8:72-878(+)
MGFVETAEAIVVGDRTVAFAVAWAGLYLTLRKFDPHTTPEWSSRIVALVHALVVTAICIASSMVVGPWAFDGTAEPNTKLQTLAMQVCLAYFIYDTAWILRYQPNDKVMLIHHMTSATGLLFSLCVGVSGCELLATIGGAEVTNPLLQARWFLKVRSERLLSDIKIILMLLFSLCLMGRKETKQHSGTRYGFAVDFLFTLTFGLFRFGLGTPLLIHEYLTPHAHWFMKMGATLLYAVSVIWYFGILKMFYKSHLRPSRAVSERDMKGD